jgi:hypothetical protein
VVLLVRRERPLMVVVVVVAVVVEAAPQAVQLLNPALLLGMAPVVECKLEWGHPLLTLVWKGKQAWYVHRWVVAGRGPPVFHVVPACRRHHVCACLGVRVCVGVSAFIAAIPVSVPNDGQGHGAGPGLGV